MCAVPSPRSVTPEHYPDRRRNNRATELGFDSNPPNRVASKTRGDTSVGRGRPLRASLRRLLLVLLFAAVAIGATGIGRVNAVQPAPPSQKMSGVAQTVEHGS